MGSYDYLRWDNPQLHKGGGCRATSRGMPACARVLFVCACTHVCISVGPCVSVCDCWEGISAPKDPFRSNIVVLPKVRRMEGGKGEQGER